MFRINAGRVKPEVKANLIRYQRECYRVLVDAFSARSVGTAVSPSASLLQVREMGLAIARMAEEQIEFEARLTKTESRLDKAAVVFGDLTKRITTLEERIAPGDPVTMEQASQISQAVKVIAIKLGERSGRNEFGGVYGRLYEKFGITSYKQLPADKFVAALAFLKEWYVSLTEDDWLFEAEDDY